MFHSKNPSGKTWSHINTPNRKSEKRYFSPFSPLNWCVVFLCITMAAGSRQHLYRRQMDVFLIQARLGLRNTWIVLELFSLFYMTFCIYYYYYHYYYYLFLCIILLHSSNDYLYYFCKHFELQFQHKRCSTSEVHCSCC